MGSDTESSSLEPSWNPRAPRSLAVTLHLVCATHKNLNLATPSLNLTPGLPGVSGTPPPSTSAFLEAHTGRRRNRQNPVTHGEPLAWPRLPLNVTPAPDHGTWVTLLEPDSRAPPSHPQTFWATWVRVRSVQFQ